VSQTKNGARSGNRAPLMSNRGTDDVGEDTDSASVGGSAAQLLQRLNEVRDAAEDRGFTWVEPDAPDPPSAEAVASAIMEVSAAWMGAGVTRMSDVEPESVAWLWPSRIPRGKLTVLDGAPKVGKSGQLIEPWVMPAPRGGWGRVRCGRA
jgi:hypothetical protein